MDASGIYYAALKIEITARTAGGLEATDAVVDSVNELVAEARKLRPVQVSSCRRLQRGAVRFVEVEAIADRIVEAFADVRTSG